MAPKYNLPAWAKVSENQTESRLEVINVDAEAMYRAWLAEFAANPADPARFPGCKVKEGGKESVIPPMTEAEAVCDPERPTKYWLECAHQCMKLELQVAMRRFNFEIRTHDGDKRFALAKWPDGRGILAATKAYEAREHFRRLRGVLPG